MRSDYDTLTDAWTLIVDKYMADCANRTEREVPVLHEGRYPTTDVLVSLWEAKEKAIDALCAAHGWTAEELEDETTRRFDASHP